MNGVIDMNGAIDIIFDMETGDPDDLWTLYFLLNCKKVNIKAITICPGSASQVGLVKRVLEQHGKTIPIGSFNPESDSKISNHYNQYVSFTPEKADFFGHELIHEFSETSTLITCGPPKNLGAAIKTYPSFSLKRWVAQGGFAGDNIVPPDLVMEKFKGLTTCPTFNFNGAPKQVIDALNDDRIKERYFVSKNVCHSVVFDEEMLAAFEQYKGQNLFIDMMIKIMTNNYLSKGRHKKIHDLLAAACAIDLSIGTFVSVELYRLKGGWGCKNTEEANPNGNIIINYDNKKFLDSLLRDS